MYNYVFGGVAGIARIFNIKNMMGINYNTNFMKNHMEKAKKVGGLSALFF